MKRLIFFCITLLGAASFTGCQMLEWTGLVPVHMDTDQANERIVSSVEKHFDADNYKLISVRWIEGRELKNNMEYLYLDMVGRDGQLYDQVIKVGGDYQGPKDIEESRSSETFDFDSVHGMKAEDIKPDVITAQYRAVKDFIPDGYKFKGIGWYDIRVNQDTGELQRKFTANITEKGKSTKLNSGSVVTDYYQLEFKGFEDGSVEYIE